MKLRCPRCEKKLSVPDKYAGKSIRCPACNRGLKVPKPQTAVAGDSGLDLEGLAALESQTTQMSGEERAGAEEALQSAAEAGKSLSRVCPHCHVRVRADDPGVERLCSHCWKPIPATAGGEPGGKVRHKRKAVSATGAGGFYSELSASVTYPVPALSSLMTAAGIAFLAALLPVVLMTGGAQLMEQGNVGTEQGVQQADLSNVQMVLIAVFSAEIFFFAAVAIHAFFDVARTTSIGDDRAPRLSFSPNQWGKSFVSYLVLAAYFAVATYVVAVLTIPGDFEEYLFKGDAKGLIANGGTPFGVGMVIVTFFIPMNLLGISLGTIGQALNPANILKSFGKTHVHYVFLVLILAVYGGLFGFAFVSILFDWFIPKIETMRAGSSEGNLLDVALPLLAWGVVMAFFFYGAYVLARLHGLFARSFRKHLYFGTQ
jgi:hypothetical protein